MGGGLLWSPAGSPLSASSQSCQARAGEEGYISRGLPQWGGGMELASERSSSMAGTRRLLTGIGDLG